MSNRSVVMTTVTVAALLILVCVPWLRARHEPSYQGKSLAEWIAPFSIQTGTNFYIPTGPSHFEELQPVRRAIAEIGTNGIPLLIRMLDEPEARFHRKLRLLANKQPIGLLRLEDPCVRRIRAARALSVLGALAQPAVPSLVSQLYDPMVAEHAVYALSGMGAEGMHALIDEYPRLSGPARMWTAMVISSPRGMYRGENYSYTNQVPIELAIEGLCRILEPPATPYQFQALQQLSLLGNSASNALPMILSLANGTNRFTRLPAIRALGSIRAQPELVIPTLEKLLTCPDFSVQAAARSALRSFGYQPDARPR
jgi:HEAT repeat protein